MKILQTERTIVSRLQLSDAPFFVELCNTPGWIQYIGDRNIKSVADAEQFLESRFLASYRTHGFGYYIIRNRNEVAVGICGFLKKPHLENPDFGFAILPSFYGQGLAHEASQAVLRYGVEQLGVHVIDAEVQPDNIASIRLLKRLGFEGIANPINEDCEPLLYRYRSPLDFTN